MRATVCPRTITGVSSGPRPSSPFLSLQSCLFRFTTLNTEVGIDGVQEIHPNIGKGVTAPGLCKGGSCKLCAAIQVSAAHGV
jgi:hypothetical protein